MKKTDKEFLRVTDARCTWGRAESRTAQTYRHKHRLLSFAIFSLLGKADLEGAFDTNT